MGKRSDLSIPQRREVVLMLLRLYNSGLMGIVESEAFFG